MRRALTPDLGQPLVEFLLISRNVCSAVCKKEESGLKWFICPNTQMHGNNHLVYSCKEGEIFSQKLSWYLSWDRCGVPFALIFNWNPILALCSIYSTFIHWSALILIDLSSIIRDIIIEYRGTASDSLYPDVSCCTLRSWASESTGCESPALVFSKLDFTHYPSCVTFTCHACCSAPPRFWLQ